VGRAAIQRGDRDGLTGARRPMLIRLIAAGTRLPAWVNDGYSDYSGRLGPEVRLELREIAVAHRSKNASIDRVRGDEGRRMLEAVNPGMYVGVLDVGGRALSSEQLAKWLAQRLADGRDVALMIGGPDGLDPGCLRRAEFRWSLSALTFPHALVRLLVAEQLYRASSILKNHPYHRA
jgi:23S rRNA (pseudouridine1915-N3)-methyltransferase